MRNIRSKLVTAAAVAAAAVASGAIANAASSSTTSSSSSSPAAPARANMPPRANMPAPGSAAHEDAEKSVTGAPATKAQAAAVKAAGGGQAGAVTTDYSGNGYEVTVTKSDGSKIEIHLDSAFNVMQGPGGPNGQPPAGPGA